MKPSIDEFWKRIIAYNGKECKMRSGGKLIYKVIGNNVDVFRGNRLITTMNKSRFEISLPHMPAEKVTDLPGQMQRSYVWAIMMDDDIKKDYWDK